MPGLSGSQLMAASARRLQLSSFDQVADTEDEFGTQIRIFENPLSIVGVAIFETWSQLEARWPAVQGRLVEIMSLNFARTDPKAWEGYLVLMTPDDSPLNQLSIDRIRRDTSRLRKFVATGSDLENLAAVDAVLLPVLPIGFPSIRREAEGIVLREAEGILDRLPSLLARHGIDEQLSTDVIEAFTANRSLVEAIWKWSKQ